MAGVLLAGFAGSAEAATVTYSFTGATTDYTLSKIFTSGVDNPVLTVSANTVSSDGAVVTPVSSFGVGQWAGNGLGIKNGSNDNSHTIDGLGLNDLLMLAFSSSVKFVSATFKYAGVENLSFDDFAFFASPTNDGSVAGDMIFASEDIIGNNGSGYYNFTTGAFGDEYIGKFFAIGAIFDAVYQKCVRYREGKCKEYMTYKVFDSFKLASVTVETLPPPPDTTPQVPLPAGLVLLLSGITGMGLFGRLKSKSSKSAA